MTDHKYDLNKVNMAKNLIANARGQLLRLDCEELMMELDDQIDRLSMVIEKLEEVEERKV